MSQENVDLVLRAADAWNSADAPASSGGLHGHDAIREVMAGWTESFKDFLVDTHEVRDLGEIVVWLGEISATIKGSDLPVRQPMGSVAWDFRGGRIGKTHFFPSWDEALEAAGLSE